MIYYIQRKGMSDKIQFLINEVSGACAVQSEIWARLNKGDWIENEIGEKENYFNSWAEYEIVGLV